MTGAALVCLLAGGCGGGSTVVVRTLPTAPPGSTPSVTSAAGAMAGFIGAAYAQANDKVATWLATPIDTGDLTEVLNVYANFGSGGQGGLFWDVTGLRVVRATMLDATHADVTLNGDIVWCLGKSAGDPAATCAAVTGVAGTPHTYRAISADGTWKVDVDINASTGLDRNPQAPATGPGPSVSPVSPSPTPT